MNTEIWKKIKVYFSQKNKNNKKWRKAKFNIDNSKLHEKSMGNG